MLDKTLIKNAIQQNKNMVIPMNYSLADRNLFKRFQLDKTHGNVYDYHGHTVYNQILYPLIYGDFYK